MVQLKAFMRWSVAACGLVGALLLLVGLVPHVPATRSPDILSAQRSQALPVPALYGPPLPLAAPASPGFRMMLTTIFSGRSLTDRSTPATAQKAPLPPVGSPIGASALPGDRRRGILFSPGSATMTLRIEPPTPRFNHGQAVEISFMPGRTCSYGDGRACVYMFSAANGIPIIYLTIHSGVGGEGQAFRHAVEGTGLNRAASTLPEIQANLEALVGARVVLSQGEKTRRQFELVGLGRLPPDRMAAYIAAPVERALPLAAEIIPGFDAFLAPESPLIIFETCGWKVNGEPGAEQASATSGSVYIGIIQENR